MDQKLASLDALVAKRKTEMDGYLARSDQPYSKWQAIFNLEQIKERNKPKLQKESMPKLPFFLFDLDKATTLEGGGSGARDFLAETFYTSFEQKRKEKESQFQSGAAALERHNVEKRLKSMLAKEETEGDADWWRKVITYMKGLTPSGVELELMNLASFDFTDEMQDNANYYVSSR